MSLKNFRTLLTFIVLCFSVDIWAESKDGPQQIKDNLFLMEEAYNQDPNVTQHIQTFLYAPASGSWGYDLTSEWPLFTQRHQISFSLPVISVGDQNAPALGDIVLNYRLQALGMGGEGPLFITPRLTLILPTGDYTAGAGRGVFGVETALAVSLELGDILDTHYNAGLAISPGARSTGGASATAVDYNLGFAVVWFAQPWMNVFSEAIYSSTANVIDDGTIERDHVFTLNPGLRFGIDFPFGLQIVPGISAPIEFSVAGVTASILGYLSFEHGF